MNLIWEDSAASLSDFARNRLLASGESNSSRNDFSILSLISAIIHNVRHTRTRGILLRTPSEFHFLVEVFLVLCAPKSKSHMAAEEEEEEGVFVQMEEIGYWTMLGEAVHRTYYSRSLFCIIVHGSCSSKIGQRRGNGGVRCGRTSLQITPLNMAISV